MDMLRAIAALMILLYHAHSIARNHAKAQGIPFFNEPFWWNSCIEMFFVMSGFLMVHMSRKLYGNRGGPKEFAIRRLVRTPPLYFGYTTAVFIIFLAIPSLADARVTFTRYFASIAFFPIELPPIIAIGWTLNYEMYFYVITGASLVLTFPFGPIFSILTLTSAVLFGAFVLRGYYLWTDPLLLNFAVGNLIAMMFYGGIVMPALGRGIALVVATALLFLPSAEDGNFVRFFTFGPAIGLVVATLTLRVEPFSMGKLGSAFYWLGSRSYTLYLSHILVLKSVEKLIYGIMPSLRPELYLAFAPVIAIAACAILFRYIEEPLTAYLKGWAKQYRRTVSSAPSSTVVS
jgi:exopolysaccharide production protein ExoZ